jgi:EAL domain-containing protein (putative c-di-GMP-specific phosphodiesterase class I)
MFAGSPSPQSKPSIPRTKVYAKAASVHELNRGIERREFVTVFQPYVSSNTGAVVALEATLRWMHPRRGYLAPCDFLCEATQYGLLDDLASVLLEQAALASARWSSSLRTNRDRSNLQVPVVVSMPGATFSTPLGQRHIVLLPGIGSQIAVKRPSDCIEILDAIGVKKIDLTYCDDTRAFLTAVLERRSASAKATVVGVSTLLQWYVSAEHGVPLVQGDFICPPTREECVEAALKRWLSTFNALNASSEIYPIN